MNLMNGTSGWKIASNINVFHEIPEVCCKSCTDRFEKIDRQPMTVPSRNEVAINKVMRKVRRANNVGNMRLDKAA